MNNKSIEDFETKVIKLNTEMDAFTKLIKINGVGPENYNHLGTLGVNLEILEMRIKHLTKVIAG